MTNVVNADGSSHNVLVVGQTDYDFYIFEDPGDGSTRMAPAQCFGANYAVVVTGLRNDN